MSADRTLARRSTHRQMAMCAQKVAASSCSSVCPTPSATATRSSQSFAASADQPGRSHGGLTAPNGPSQERSDQGGACGRRSHAGRHRHIEAHGTGTSLGDPIEMQALGAVFGARSPQTPLMVGSVKTNIGHAEAAAGIMGLIKAALVLQRRTIPAHLHLRKPNPLIAWDRYPIMVPHADDCMGVERQAATRRVSAHSDSAARMRTSCWKRLRQSRPRPAAKSRRAAAARAVSGDANCAPATRPALRGCVGSSRMRPALSDVARTCGASVDSHFAERLAIFATDIADAAPEARRRSAAGETGAGIVRGRVAGNCAGSRVRIHRSGRPVCPLMGMRLMESQPVFKQAMEKSAPDCSSRTFRNHC